MMEEVMIARALVETDEYFLLFCFILFLSLV